MHFSFFTKSEMSLQDNVTFHTAFVSAVNLCFLVSSFTNLNIEMMLDLRRSR